MLLPSYHLKSKRKPLRLTGFCNLNKTALVKNQTTKIVMTINLPLFIVGGVLLFVCLFVCLFFGCSESNAQQPLWGEALKGGVCQSRWKTLMTTKNCKR